ncbi:hypothetical protein D3C87_1178720 [compost metagenome]
MTLRLHLWLLTALVSCAMFLQPQHAVVGVCVLIAVGFNMTWRDLSQQVSRLDAMMLLFLIEAVIVEGLRWRTI